MAASPWNGGHGLKPSSSGYGSMCGLVGLFLPRHAQPVDADLTAMLRVIAHRGPDGTGTHVSADRRFQGGFTRLAIIDLATSDQPLVEDGGSRVFLGNGEIYNYRELRAELRDKGHVFHTQGDMEVGLKAYVQYGRDFVHRLNGMYGLALYERDAHRLLLVRDRLGIKPLYWARLEGGGILFASEIKSLFTSGLVEPRVDESRLSTWLLHGYVPAPDTLYAGVGKLPPGHWLSVAADGAVTVERYWRPRAAADLPRDAAAAKAHLLGLLEDSVRLQLHSDVPLGILLSGGIDSGLVTALAARHSATPLHTYTVRFAGAPVDESPLARAVAGRYGTRHTQFELGMDDVCAHLPALAWHCDEPLFDASLLPNHLINAVLGRDIRVVLNGSGGDELFAGYGRYFPLAAERRWLALPTALRAALRPLIGAAAPLRAWQLERAELLERDPGAYLADHTTQFPAPLRRRLGRGEAVTAAHSAAFAAFAGPRQSGMLAADLETYLPEDLMLLLDRTTMAASVEGRVPFLDHRLVEAALALPPELRTPGGRQKGLEREMAAELLPAEVLNAPKQGFASPVPAWFAGDLGRLSRRVLTGARSRRRGWFDPAGIDALLADPVGHAFRLYALTMLELTVRTHVEGRFTAPPALEELVDD